LASIRRRGKAFLVSYRLPAKSGQKAPQRTKSFATEKEAKLFENEQDRLKLEGRAARNGRLPFADLLQEHLADRKVHLKPSTYALYSELTDIHLIPALGHHPIERVDQKLLSKHFASLTSEGRKDGKDGGLSGSRINAMQTIVRQAMKNAVLWNYLAFDPSAGVKRLSYRAREMACLDPTSLSKLVEVAANPSRRAIEQAGLSTDPVFASLVRFLAETGCRKGEALALQWSSVDLARGQVTIERSVSEVRGAVTYGTPKNGERRKISIEHQPGIIQMLRALHARQAAAKLQLGKGYAHAANLVFCWPNGEAIRGETFGHAFAALVKRTNVPRIRLHDLRHTHASILINAGASALEVSRRLGHKTVSVTLDIYSHLFPAQDARLSETFAQAMRPEPRQSPRNNVVRSVVPALAG
jgi:integrase